MLEPTVSRSDAGLWLGVGSFQDSSVFADSPASQSFHVTPSRRRTLWHGHLCFQERFSLSSKESSLVKFMDGVFWGVKWLDLPETHLEFPVHPNSSSSCLTAFSTPPKPYGSKIGINMDLKMAYAGIWRSALQRVRCMEAPATKNGNISRGKPNILANNQRISLWLMKVLAPAATSGGASTNRKSTW